MLVTLRVNNKVTLAGGSIPVIANDYILHWLDASGHTMQ